MTTPVNIKYNSIYDLYDSYNFEDIEYALVKKYINQKQLDISKSTVISQYLQLGKKSTIHINLDSYFLLTIKDLEKYFELLISNEDRKEHGAFFTPEYVIKTMIREVKPKENDINLDPSCGCGAFLLGLVDYYMNTFNKSIKSIVKENICGIDIQQRNIDRSKILLSLLALENNELLSDEDFNLKCKNSLLCEWNNIFNNIKSFDNIIGNPPYGNNETIYLDNYLSFMMKSTKYLKSNSSILSFIIPISWISSTKKNIQLFRNDFFNSIYLNRLIVLPFGIFEDAYVDNSIMIASKQKANKYEVYVYDKSIKLKDIKINKYNMLSRNNMLSNPLKINSLLEDVKDNLDKSKVIYLNKDICNSSIGILKSKYIFVDKKEEDYHLPYFEGSLYRYDNNLEFKGYIVDFNNRLLNNKSFIDENRLLVRRIVNRKNRIMCALSDDKYIVKKDLYSFVVPSKINKNYLLAIMNSKLISYMILSQNPIATKNDFRQISLNDLRTIPVLNSNCKISKQIIKLATNYNASCDKKLDSLIYELYGVPKETIKQIEIFIKD